MLRKRRVTGLRKRERGDTYVVPDTPTRAEWNLDRNKRAELVNNVVESRLKIGLDS